jgi:hypothetical protein
LLDAHALARLLLRCQEELHGRPRHDLVAAPVDQVDDDGNTDGADADGDGPQGGEECEEHVLIPWSAVRTP